MAPFPAVCGKPSLPVRSKIGLPLWLGGEAAYSFVLSTLRIFVYLLAGQILSGIHLHWEHLPQVLLTLFLTVCAITSMGFVSAAFILVFKKGDPLNWGFSVLSWLLGGVYYPVSVLPDWGFSIRRSACRYATAWKPCGYVCSTAMVTGL